jgi:RHS repeat-associated protein
MKTLVIFLILLIVSMPISYAKVVDIPGITSGESEEPEALRDGPGVKKFVYAGSGIIASIESSEIKYYHQGRMSNRITTDSDGNKDKEFKSLPFGQKILNSGVDYAFTGKQEDESSLYYFGARYYDDNLGRFTGVDPVKENHPYAYVKNNPMNYVDPTGMEEEAYGPPVPSWEFGINENQGTADFMNRNDPEYMMGRHNEDLEASREEARTAINAVTGYYSFMRLYRANGDYNYEGATGDLFTIVGVAVLWAPTTIRGASSANSLLTTRAFGSRAGAGRGPSYGRVPAESVRFNNQDAFKTVLRGERPVALLESGGGNHPSLRVSDMQLKIATEGGHIGGYIKSEWYAVNGQGVRGNIPNQFTIVYGKGAHAEGLAKELAKLYSGDIQVRPGHLPGFNHARVGQILHYPDDEIASFLSSNKGKIAGQ